MKPDVWMPFYIGDYLGDTGRLTTEQHGAYLLLIFDYWRNGPPADDNDDLASITKLSPETWLKHRPKIERFFRIADGVWHHKRIDEELAEARSNADHARARAKTAAAARWARADAASRATSSPAGTANGNAPSIASAVPEECPSPSPSPSPSPLPSEGVGANAPTWRKASPRASKEPTEAELATFERFWAVYPRRKAKKEALAAFVRVVRANLATVDELVAGATAYAGERAGKDPEKTAHATTWLNQARWNDEPDPLPVSMEPHAHVRPSRPCAIDLVLHRRSQAA